MIESQESTTPPKVVLSQASGGMPTWAVFLVEGIRSGSVSTCTGVTRKSGHAPPLGWTYAPRHRPTVGP